MPEIYKSGKNYSGGTILPPGGLKGQALLKHSNAQDDFEWGDIKGVTYTYIVGSTPLAADWLSLTASGTALVPDPGMVYLIVTEGEYFNNFVRWDATNLNYIVISSGGGGALLTGTLLANSWSNKTQTVSLTGIKSSSVGVVGLLNTATQEQIDAASESIIRVTSISTNSIIFVCEQVPTVDIPFGVITGIGGGGSSSGGGGGAVFCYIDATKTALDDDWLLDEPGGDTIEPKEGVLYCILTSGDYYNSFYRFNESTNKYVLVIDPSSGGHVIVNSSGTEMTQQTKLKFVGATVTDDDTNGQTVVTVDMGGVYKSSDATITDLENEDSIPVLDDSASATKKTLWSNVKAKLKTYFDELYGILFQSNGTTLTKRGMVNFIDLSAEDNETDEITDVAPHRLTSEELEEILSEPPVASSNLPVMFDERGTEYQVGWYVLANGKKKPVYRKDYNVHITSKGYFTVDANFVSSNNVDTVIKINNLYDANKAAYFETGDPDTGGIATVRDSGKLQSSISGSGSIDVYMLISVYFTKTTDTPI